MMSHLTKGVILGEYELKKQVLPVEEELVARVGVEPVLQHDLLGQQDRPVLLVEPPQLLSEMT